MQDALTVSQFVEAVNFALDALQTLTVQGEVSEYRVIHQKWVTFLLKDEKSSIGCFMPIWQLRTQIEDGMLVTAMGKPRLREKGFFSFVVDAVQPTGEGALMRAFELLKAKMETEGLFAQERKRTLPRFPEHIALITSRDAAAYDDFIKVLTARRGGLRISFFHTQVQGATAPAQIIEALERANTDIETPDAIVLVRGGGSMEDLHAFNDEMVVRAVSASRTPIIVGVGHERDVTLAELASDVRASTPSNAAELLVRSREETLGDIAYMTQSLRGNMHEAFANRIHAVTQNLSTLKGRMSLTEHEVSSKIQELFSYGERLIEYSVNKQESVLRLKESLINKTSTQIDTYTSTLSGLSRILTTLSPKAILKRGYSLTRDTAGKVITSARQLSLGTQISTTFADGEVTSRVL